MVCSYVDDEILTFLDLVIDTNSFRKIDGKSQSNIKIFEMLAEKMKQRIENTAECVAREEWCSMED